MAGWNGSGGFTRIYSWVADAAANIPITASRMDSDTDNITTNGFNNCLTRDGQGSATANQPMNGFKHIGASNAVGAGQYMTYAQVVGVYLPLTGGTVAGGLAITGAASVGLTLGVTGAATFGSTIATTGNATIGGTLGVAGAATLASLGVTAGATIGGNLGVTGTLGVTGATTLSSTLGVTGATTLSSVGVSGNATVGGTLGVTGTLTGGTVSTVTLSASGASTLFNTTINGTLGVGQAGQFNMDLTIIGNCFANTFTPTSDARVKTDARLITADEGERWIRSVPPRIYRKSGNWEAGFYAQDIDAAGFGDVLALIDDDKMTAEMNGSRGPSGKKWGVRLGAAEAYLAAALASALDKIEALTTRIGAVEGGTKQSVGV